MKKLSRKNKLGIEQSMAEERQRYSFRKLNSGILVSAAIGAFLFFGAGNAQAATTDSSQDNVTPAKQTQTDTTQQSEQNKLQQKKVTLANAQEGAAKQGLSTPPSSKHKF